MAELHKTMGEQRKTERRSTFSRTVVEEYIVLVLTLLQPCHAVPVSIQQAVVGDRVQLDCTTPTSDPVDWTRQRDGDLRATYVYAAGAFVNGYGERYRMNHTNDFDYSLVIARVELNDSGIYTCTENGGLGSELTRIKLAVTRPRPFEMNPTGSRDVPEGGELSIECATGFEESVDFVCYPKFATNQRVLVYANHAMVRSFDGRVSVQADSDQGEYKLSIRNITADLSGMFMCEENSGVGPGRAHVQVNIVPRIAVTPKSGYCQYCDGNTLGFGGEPVPHHSGMTTVTIATIVAIVVAFVVVVICVLSCKHQSICSLMVIQVILKNVQARSHEETVVVKLMRDTARA